MTENIILAIIALTVVTLSFIPVSIIAILKSLNFK